MAWPDPVPPPDGPAWFHIGVWTDVPAVAGAFSHPGQLIWQWLVPRSSVDEHVVGCDFQPDHGSTTDTCFRYDFVPAMADWFIQEPGCNIYWISISAVYSPPGCACNGDVNGDGTVDAIDVNTVASKIGCPVGTGDLICDQCDIDCDGDVDQHDMTAIQCLLVNPADPTCCTDVGAASPPWGWKTRPHFYMDDAVRIFNPSGPVIGDAYGLGEPIVDALGVSWDMAFVLTTDQPPVPKEACCLNDPAMPCQNLTPTDCINLGGTPLGSGTQCESPEMSCADNLDNDCDGCVDTADSDCGGAETACADGLDNDCDGLIDCSDPDCAADPACQQACCVPNAATPCLVLPPSDCINQSGTPQGPGTVCESPEMSCADSADNDCDGCVDAADSDCGGTETSCTDNLDNDCDGLIDCSDPDCAGTINCQPAACCLPTGAVSCLLLAPSICTNQGGTPQAAGTLCESPEMSCADSADNDCDGCVDAADSDCGGTEAACADNLDNDCDGLIDCLDPDCAADPACNNVQACCLPDGTCLDIDPQQCTCTYGGMPQGSGTSCASGLDCPVKPIPVGMNVDIHQDNPGIVANDFHIEGVIESSRVPALVQHIDDLFPNFTYSITQGQPQCPTNSIFYCFVADWSGFNYPYCNVLHLGLLFEVTCRNVMVDLVGWWTVNGVRVGGPITAAKINGPPSGGTTMVDLKTTSTDTTSALQASPGYWPIMGFRVEDDISTYPPDPANQFIRFENGNLNGIAEPPEIPVEIVQLELVSLSADAMRAALGADPLSELRLGGLQDTLPWVPVGNAAGPISTSNPKDFQVDSFFDVALTGPGGVGQFTTATPMLIEPDGFLIARGLMHFLGNGTTPIANASTAADEFRWFWDLHGAHSLPVPEGCCLPDGTCAQLLPADCLCQGGTPQGLNTMCEVPEISCGDGGDNDCDGCTDGVDSDCGGTETSCTDGLDNDCDGLIDCVDPDCNTDPACLQACCNLDGSCTMDTHNGCVAAGGDPQGPISCTNPALSCQPLKWAQPPVFDAASPHPECFWGWDEFSLWGSEPGPYIPPIGPGLTAPPRIIADDWLCNSAKPVTDVHWWGSYLNWTGVAAPDGAPAWFRIGLWTDVANPGGFSHPGTMLTEWIVPRSALNERPVACDFHTEYTPLSPEGCFRYDYHIPAGQWFFQDAACNIYWVSIAPMYMGAGCACNGDVNGDGVVTMVDLALVQGNLGCPVGTGDPLCDASDIDCDGEVDLHDASAMACHVMTPGNPACCNNPGEWDIPWGWKTRPHLFMDDAVRITQPTAPIPGSTFTTGEPITDLSGVSWDMAFVLTTVNLAPNAPVLCAPPDDLHKMKYLSVDATTNGSQPLQMKVVNVSTGKMGWVDYPNLGPTVPKRAILVPVAPTAQDWSADPVVNITGCIIQPGEDYRVTFVDPSTGLESAPLLVSTTDRWGNVNDDSAIDIVDVVASILIFTSQGTAGFYPATHGDVVGDAPEGSLDIVDVVSVIFGFSTQGTQPASQTPLPMCP